MPIQITLTDTQVAALLCPPEGVDAAAYLAHINKIFANVPAKRPPGRPVQYGHPAYSEAEYRAIRAMIATDVEEYPEHYVSVEGKPARGLAKEQPSDETVFILNNGVELHYSERIRVANDGRIDLPYPPVIIGVDA